MIKGYLHLFPKYSPALSYILIFIISLMQLNIGGAETHVVELAKELKRKGFNVIVTSNGNFILL